MTRGILIDDETLLLHAEGKWISAGLDELDDVLGEPADIAVIPCEVARIVAPNKAVLDRLLTERFGEGWVVAEESVSGPVYQAFGMRESTLQRLRACCNVRAVVPYPLVVREGRQQARLSFDDFNARPTTVVKIALGEQNQQWVAIDRLPSGAVVTAGHGNEIAAVRVLPVDEDFEREVFVTLQGAKLHEPVIGTVDRQVAEKLRHEGHVVDVLELPKGIATLGMLGMEKLPATRFYLPADLARMRQEAERKRQQRSIYGALGLFVVAVGLTIGAFARMQSVRHDLLATEARGRQSVRTLEALYAERYASYAAAANFDVPQAWAELEFVLPPQLRIEEVTISPGLLRAHVERRQGQDQGHHPVGVADIRAALGETELWKNARVDLVLDTHAISYTLETRR